MKKSEDLFRKELEALVNGMTDEQLTASLEKAGLEFYKNVRVRVFSEPEDDTLERSPKNCDLSDEFRLKGCLYSLPAPEVDYYENVQIPFFQASWGISINAWSELPCFLPGWRPAQVTADSFANWYYQPWEINPSTVDVDEEEYQLAA